MIMSKYDYSELAVWFRAKLMRCAYDENVLKLEDLLTLIAYFALKRKDNGPKTFF